jgi:hypothetical protein
MDLTNATKSISDAYKKDRLASYKLAVESLVNTVLYPINTIITDGKFDSLPLPKMDKDVLLVWSRYTGTKTPTGFNPEGDSDPTGQNQLVRAGLDLGFEVITLGDILPEKLTKVTNEAPFQLGHFWNGEPLEDRGRAWQCAFFAALMQRYPGRLYQIGQKTGAMDYMALLGVPTIYIEDAKIPTAASKRMLTWTGDNSIQLYRRLEVSNLPVLSAREHVATQRHSRTKRRRKLNALP